MISDVATKEYTCALCQTFKAKLPSKVKNHLEAIHFPGMFLYNCDICFKTFKGRNAFNIHKTKANEHFNDSQKGEMLELEDQDEEEDAESLEKHLNLIHSGSDCTNTSNKALFKVSEQAIKPRKDNSPVWLCAVKLSNDMSQCKICKKNIPTLGGSTSNIAGHLSRQHSDVKEVMEVQRMLLEKKKMRDCKYKNL